MPVTLPPGRLRLATRPNATGSPPAAKTIGMVVVAAFAASAAAVPPATITATRRRTRSAASAGSRSILALRPAVFDRHVLALDIAGFLEALAERDDDGLAVASADWELRNPITGTAGCCARATTGHAAAPPSPAMNSRRRIRHPLKPLVRAAYRGRGCMSGLEALSFLQRGRPLVCRVADAGHNDASTRANSRRRQLAKGRNRGRWGAEGAAGAMGI